MDNISHSGPEFQVKKLTFVEAPPISIIIELWEISFEFLIIKNRSYSFSLQAQ